MEIVKIVVLTTGQQLISKFLDGQMIEPRVLNLIPDSKTGSMRVGLLPWVIGNKEGQPLSVDDIHIVTLADAEPELEKMYLNSISIIKIPAPGSNPQGMKLIK